MDVEEWWVFLCFCQHAFYFLCSCFSQGWRQNIQRPHQFSFLEKNWSIILLLWIQNQKLSHRADICQAMTRRLNGYNFVLILLFTISIVLGSFQPKGLARVFFIQCSQHVGLEKARTQKFVPHQANSFIICCGTTKRRVGRFLRAINFWERAAPPATWKTRALLLKDKIFKVLSEIWS
jgi:hypothetical protein